MSLDPTTTTARLLALPSLREQAEREYASRVQTQVQDLAMQRAARLRGTEVEARLLADLTRWQSQAWALREIGRLLRWDVGNRVPELSCLNHGAGPELCWAVTRSPINVSGNNVAQFYDEWPYYAKPESRHKILGMSRITDRPAAIAAILLHLSESR